MKQSSRNKTSRDAILDATDRLLSDIGFKKMTIDDLAKEVGIGKGSVYLHFESKEDLALSHVDRIADRLRNSLDEIARRGGSCEKRLRAMLLERVMFRFDSVQHYTQSLNELLASVRPKLLERRKRYFETETRLFASILSEGQTAGVFEFKNAGLTAASLLDATNSLLPYSLSAYELGERSEIEKKTNRVIDLILGGVLKH